MRDNLQKTAFFLFLIIFIINVIDAAYLGIFIDAVDQAISCITLIALYTTYKASNTFNPKQLKIISICNIAYSLFFTVYTFKKTQVYPEDIAGLTLQTFIMFSCAIVLWRSSNG